MFRELAFGGRLKQPKPFTAVYISALSSLVVCNLYARNHEDKLPFYQRDITGATPINYSPGSLCYFDYANPNPALGLQSFPEQNSEAETDLVATKLKDEDGCIMVGAAWQQDRYSQFGGSSADFLKLSHDNGQTWGPPIPTRAGMCYGGPFERQSDPHIAITTNGNVYVSSLPLSVIDPNTPSGAAVDKFDSQGNFKYEIFFDIGDATNSPDGPGFTAGTDYTALISDPADPKGNTVYLAYEYFPNNIGPQSLIKFSSTTDGKKWSGTPSTYTFSPLGVTSYAGKTINNIIPQTIFDGSKPSNPNPSPRQGISTPDGQQSLWNAYGQDSFVDYQRFVLIDNPVGKHKKSSQIVLLLAATTGTYLGQVPPKNFYFSMNSTDGGKNWSKPSYVTNYTGPNILDYSSDSQQVDPDTLPLVQTNSTGAIINGTGAKLALVRAGGAGIALGAADRANNIIYVVILEHSLMPGTNDVNNPLNNFNQSLVPAGDGQPTGIYLYISRDSAKTWQKVEQRLNTVATTQALLPNIAVLEDGRIAVTYMDFRNHKTNNLAQGGPLETDEWLAIYSVDCDNRLTLCSEARLTKKSFDFRKGANVLAEIKNGVVINPAGYFVGDYNALVSLDNTLYTNTGWVPPNAVAIPPFAAEYTPAPSTDLLFTRIEVPCDN